MNSPSVDELLERIEHELRDEDMGTVYSRLRRVENGLLELVDICGLLLRRIEDLEAINDLVE